MSFTPNIPQSGQTLGSSRLQVLNNFANYNTVMSVNHVAPNASGQGKHKFVEMPVQGSNPVILNGEGCLFTKTTSGKSEMFYLRDGVGTTYQMTGPCSIGASGYTTLFGGLILQWALVSASSTPATYNFPIPFPNNLFNITLGSVAGTQPNSSSITSFTLSQFTIRATASFSVYYMALGN